MSTPILYFLLPIFVGISAIITTTIILSKFSLLALGFVGLLATPLLLFASALVWITVDVGGSWWIERRSALKAKAAADVAGVAAGGVGRTGNLRGVRRTIIGSGGSAYSNQSHQRDVKPLLFTSPAAWSVILTRSSWENTIPPSSSTSTPLAEALDSLFSLILRDFVQVWYSKISTSPTFPQVLESTIRYSMLEIAKRIERTSSEEWSELIVGRIVPILTKHLEGFSEAESTLRSGGTAGIGGISSTGSNPSKTRSSAKVTSHLTQSAELDLFLSSTYAQSLPSGKLHSAVDSPSPLTQPLEESHLTSLVDKILPLVMKESEVGSGAVRILTRELVGRKVLTGVVDMLGDPDFWNKMIDEKAGAAIRDQKMVLQFREALDRQNPSLAPPSPVQKSRSRSRRKEAEEISSKTSAKDFDAFVRGIIGKSGSLWEVRRLRSDLGGQVRKCRDLIQGRGGDDLVDGQKVSDMINHMERLLGALKKIDRRIEELGGLESSARNPILADASHTRSRHISLQEILLEPTSLSYFMEFQDRRSKSMRVQFWLLVEGLKDPLVDTFDPSEEGGGVDTRGRPQPSAETIATTKEDIKMIWDNYFEDNKLHSNLKYIRAAKLFLNLETDPRVNRTPPLQSATDLHNVRKAVFLAQEDVLREMEEEDFPLFEKSELYFKALANIPELVTSTTVTKARDDTASDALLSSPVMASRLPRFKAGNTPPSLPHPSSTLPSRIPFLNKSVSPASTRPTSPSPSYKSLTFQRSDQAPAKSTTQQPILIQPLSRRNTLTDGAHGGIYSKSSSVISSDHTVGLGIGSLEAFRRRPPVLSDSLDFLMATPAADDEVIPGAESRSPLFEDEPFTSSAERNELDVSDEDYVQIETIEAISEALNSILATDARHQQSFLSPSLTDNQEFTRRRVLVDTPEARKPTSTVAQSSRATTPSSSMLFASQNSSLVEKRTSRKVFDDDEEGDLSELEEESEEPEFDPKSVRLAAPGDLQLPIEIARLGATIERLNGQEFVVGALIRKAELTGISSELKLLVKSRESLRREIRATEFQKSQFESQESQNKLEPGRTSVSISGTTVGQQANGQSFQLYLVELHQLATDGSYSSGWIVTRRYSEFAALHAGLKEKFGAAVRGLELPSKRLVTSFTEGFVEQRRLGLEKYIQSLVQISAVCQSSELRAFLSQQNISLPTFDLDASKKNLALFPGQSLARSFYRSVTSGIDDMFSTGPSSMLDTIVQRLSQQAAELPGNSGFGMEDEDMVGSLLAGKRSGVPSVAGEEGLSYFTAPICDLFVTLFELKEKNNWLRRQAILIILQQILGGTIERKFRDAVKMVMGADQLLSYIEIVKNGMWPGGALKPKEAVRTAAQKLETRESANRKLSALMPDIAANFIGRANARQGARSIFAVLQNRRLNKHIIYTIVDEIVAVLFPELLSPPTSPPAPFSVPY